ncbi:glycosyltransferase [Candidatus Poribacteria bacterium]|nr:glycosyltransferase [Candidatus Poribacteria bacterium]
MKIVHIVPGAGNTFYCENCLRDNGRARILRQMGHDVIAIPMYLPILTDEANQTTDTPLFFGGINVYLQQKFSIFRKTPRWLDKLFDSPKLLGMVADKSGMTDPVELAEMTLSMLKGEEGNQVKELERLVAWLAKEEKPDVVHLSNALLIGIARRIKQELNVPVFCSLQDEDIWIDPIPEPYQQTIWDTLSERAAELDGFISVSEYFKNFMSQRARIPAERIHVVYNGLNMEGYVESELPTNPPVIGFLERQCREKGLGELVKAFIEIRKRGRLKDLKLKIMGGKTAEDKRLINELQEILKGENLSNDVEFLPNPSREEKMEFLKSITVMSVPAVHQEAFGLYIIEALAMGVPVVVPKHGAFSELLSITGGGFLCEPNSIESLADSIESLLLEPEHAVELGRRGRKIVTDRFTVEKMAIGFLNVLETVVDK